MTTDPIPTEGADGLRFPIDYDSVKKGDYLSPDECIRILRAEPRWRNIDRMSRLYSLALLDLIEEIRHELATRKRPVELKSDKDGIRFLTDEETVYYADEQANAGLRKFRRNHYRSIECVNVDNLTEAARRFHERAVLVRGAKLLGLHRHRSFLPKTDQLSPPAIEGPAE